MGLATRRAAPILVVAEGADWLVVSKPPHLLVHPTKPGGPITLLDLLRAYLAADLPGGGQVSLIHRLDRETSGLMLIAKTAGAARRFSLAMMRGQIRKEYLALVWGWPDWEAHVVDAPLLRQGAREPFRIWLKQMTHPEGAPARTAFEVVRRFEREGGGRFSLVRARPETGRMHQLRVHLAGAGRPIVGDKIYGPDEAHYLRFIETGWTPELAAALLLDRQALHAHRLSFEPAPGEPVREVEAPMPEDMAAFMAGGA